MSTRRPGAEDPGEAWADSLQEFMRAEPGLRRGYKSPEDVDVGEMHSHLQDPMGLGDTHRDGQESHECTPCVWAWGGGPADTTPKTGKPLGYSLPPSPLWGTSLRWWGKGRHTLTLGAPVKTHCSWGKSHREPTAPAER